MLLLLNSLSPHFSANFDSAIRQAGHNLERVESLDAFLASPLRTKPFLALFEIGGAEDIERALIAFDWIESVQPLAPVRVILILASKNIDLGERRRRFGNAELTILPMPAKNFLFKLELQQRLVKSDPIKNPEGFAAHFEEEKEKGKRVLVLKGPSPAQGHWQSHGFSPKGTVRWRWVGQETKKPHDAGKVELAWEAESKAAPIYDEKKNSWVMNEEDADILCLRKGQEFYSAKKNAVTKAATATAEETEKSLLAKEVEAKKAVEIAKSLGIGRVDESGVQVAREKQAAAREKANSELQKAKVVVATNKSTEDAAPFSALKHQRELGTPGGQEKNSTTAGWNTHQGGQNIGAPNTGTSNSSENIPKTENLDSKENTKITSTAPVMSADAQARERNLLAAKEKLKLEQAAAKEMEERKISGKSAPAHRNNSEAVGSFSGKTPELDSIVSASLEAVSREAPKSSLSETNRISGDAQNRLGGTIGKSFVFAEEINSEEKSEKNKAPSKPKKQTKEEEEGEAAAAKAKKIIIEQEELPPKAALPREENAAPATKTKAPLQSTLSEELKKLARAIRPTSEENSTEQKNSNENSASPANDDTTRIESHWQEKNEPVWSVRDGQKDLSQEERHFGAPKKSDDIRAGDALLASRHFVILSLSELRDQNSSWHPVENYRIYLSANHRYYGVKHPGEIFPLWVYNGELAPEFLEGGRGWKFYDRGPELFYSLDSLPTTVANYVRKMAGLPEAGSEAAGLERLHLSHAQAQAQMAGDSSVPEEKINDSVWKKIWDILRNLIGG
jgi:hypothetical protein